MSLMRQMILLVTAATLLAFAGSLFISVWSARNYLSLELQRKNNDNANALALSMTQQKDKDAVTVELQVTALFDTGYYQRVSVLDPLGNVIAERVNPKSDTAAPQWFVNWFPIESTPGVAQINEGWKQFGTVTVVSHSQFAYDALWAQSRRFLLWFVVGGLLVGLLGAAILRAIARSLGDVVRQADAIKGRRFVTVKEPRPVELKAVTRAMNDMVERVKAMFAEEAIRLEAMRTRVNRDAVTGLAVRDYFTAHLREVLEGEQFSSVGSLVIVRLADIGRINSVLGHARTDELLKTLGQTLYDSGHDRPGQRAGRLQGGEFAIICPTFDRPADAARDIHERLQRDWLPQWHSEIPDLYNVAAVGYARYQAVSDLMMRADAALARAVTQGPNCWYASDEIQSAVTMPGDRWRAVLSGAVKQSQFTLDYYPVSATDGRLLHREGSIRLRVGDPAVTLAAGDFMPMAAKLNLSPPIDLNVTQLAIRRLSENDEAVAINLAAETINDYSFRSELQQLLKATPEESRRRLLFEAPEYGVFRHFDAFRDLAQMLKAQSCRVGIEYFGQRFAESDKLAALGLDYIKVHPSYVRGIGHNAGNQEFLKGVCRMAHNLGIQVIAIGVESKDELTVIATLGFDGATGPAVKG
jgi:diguanylate cyclase (GGDEF)-like protein